MNRLSALTPTIDRRALLTSALAAALAHRRAGSAEPVRIGLTLGLTGRYEKLGTMMQRGFLLWEQDVNERGGLLGRPVQIVIEDDGSEADRAVQLYEKLIHQEAVDFVFGPYSSAITAAVAPVTEKAGYPMLAAGAASDRIWQQGYANVFGVFTPASRYAVGMLNLALIHDLAAVAIVSADDDFSNTAAQGTERWALKLGLDVVMHAQFEKGRRDLAEFAENARLAGANLVIMAGHFEESVDMRRALEAVAWYPQAYYATIGPVLQRYHDILSDAANLTFANSFWEPELRYPESRRFAANFRSRFRMTPSYQAADAYAAGQILETAINSAGSLEPDAVRRALGHLETQTVIGRYGVDPTGVQVKHFALTIQWRDGKKEIVWPEELATSAPRFSR